MAVNAQMLDSTPAPQNRRGGLLSSLSLEQKLILALLVLGIIPLIIMGALSYLRSQAILRDSVESELQSVVNLTDDRVQRWLQARENDARTYSSSHFVTGDQEGVLALGLRVITTQEGTPEARTAEAAAREGLESIIEATGDTYSAIYLARPDGVVAVGVRNEPLAAEFGETVMSVSEGHRFQDEAFFTPFFNDMNAQPYALSAVMSYDPLGVPAMFIAHRILNSSNGETIGAIILQISPLELQGLMENFAGGDGQTYLQSGDYLVTTDDIIPTSELQDEAREGFHSADTEAGVETVADGFTDDASVLGSWQGFNPGDAPGYVVYAQIPRGAALADVNGLLYLLIAVGAVSIFIIGGVAYVFAKRVMQPISNLTMAAQEIAGGSLNTRVDSGSEDEIGKLAEAFNNMTDNLRVRVYEETRNREYLEDVLTSYMKFVERVSRGDLTARLSLNGQTGANLIVANVNAEQDDNLLRLGYNLNRMVEALHSMASQTRDVARSLSASAVEILESSTRQISSTTQQDASVSQTTSTVAEVRATVAETAERAQMVAEAAQQSVEISRQGQHAVAETIEGMNLIRSRVESIAENILMLSERTTQIGDIIATVNAIADQSKMLALNASIEAARAGEEGRGFAVVAMEVRNLAEQSREATAQVRDILSEIQQATNTAVMVTEEGTKGVDLGVQLVDRAGRAIRELAGKLEDAAQAAMQIAASTRQQSQGMDQLTAAMSSIKAATSSTATSMQQSQRNAKDLNEMARQMESAISQYKL